MMRAQTYSKATVERGDCALYLSPGISVASQDIEAGFRWLESWDVLMPLLSYERLAEDYEHDGCSGNGQLLDMRQMVYDERVIFVRHGSSADDLLAARNDEACVDEICPLPLLRAIWKVKPLLLALPTVWVRAV